VADVPGGSAASRLQRRLNIRIEYRWVEANAAQLPELGADLVRLKPDLIATYGSLFTGALKAATSSIPIVFIAHADPVGTGHVTSLARPGGRQQEPEGQPDLHHVRHISAGIPSP
jgi:ABC-type uncharacterized transport system substrate-binding protein